MVEFIFNLSGLSLSLATLFAMRFDGTTASRDEIIDAFGFVGSDSQGSRCTRLVVSTPEGTVSARPGDWVIKDSFGAMYCRTQDYFDRNYEAV